MAPSTDVQVFDTTAVTVFTPEQSAYLAKLAEAGTAKEALEAAGVDRRTLRAWRQDSAFVEALEDARRDYTERLIRLGYAAIEKATPEELLLHPNAWMFSVKQLDGSFKDNAPMVQVTVQQVQAVFSPEQLAAAARALAGVAQGEDIA